MIDVAWILINVLCAGAVGNVLYLANRFRRLKKYTIMAIVASGERLPLPSRATIVDLSLQICRIVAEDSRIPSSYKNTILEQMKKFSNIDSQMIYLNQIIKRSNDYQSTGKI